jgi:hypothetical protein
VKGLCGCATGSPLHGAKSGHVFEGSDLGQHNFQTQLQKGFMLLSL